MSLVGLNKLKFEELFSSLVGLNRVKFVGLCSKLKSPVKVVSVKDGRKRLRFEGGVGGGAEGGEESGLGEGGLVEVVGGLL